MFKVSILLCNYLWRMEVFSVCCPSLSFSSLLITACWHWDRSRSSPLHYITTLLQPSQCDLRIRLIQYTSESRHRAFSLLQHERNYSQTHTYSPLWIRVASLKSCIQEAKKELNSFLLLTEKDTLIKYYICLYIFSHTLV